METWHQETEITLKNWRVTILWGKNCRLVTDTPAASAQDAISSVAVTHNILLHLANYVEAVQG